MRDTLLDYGVFGFLVLVFITGAGFGALVALLWAGC